MIFMFILERIRLTLCVAPSHILAALLVCLFFIGFHYFDDLQILRKMSEGFL